MHKRLSYTCSSQVSVLHAKGLWPIVMMSQSDSATVCRSVHEGLNLVLTMQLFSAFDICGGCRKLNHSYDDDVGGCLPLTRRRGSDGRRRIGLTNWGRVTLVAVSALLLLVMILCLGHPQTQVTRPSVLHQNPTKPFTVQKFRIWTPPS